MQEVRHKPLKTILLACIIEAQCSAGMNEQSIQKDTKKVQSKKSHIETRSCVWGHLVDIERRDPHMLIHTIHDIDTTPELAYRIFTNVLLFLFLIVFRIL